MRRLIILLLLCFSPWLYARTVPVSFIKAMKICGDWGQYQKKLFEKTDALVNSPGEEKLPPQELSRAQYKLAMLCAYGVGTKRDFKS